MKDVTTGDDQPLLPAGVVAMPSWSRVDYLLASALAILAFALRLPGLNEGLWVDEIATLVSFVRQPPLDIVFGPTNVNNHVLYSLSAHFSIALFGESAWALRLPAVLFGVATVPAAYYLGRQLASQPEAFLASLFLVLNYQHVWFSQNARGYTGLLFGAVLATVLFIRLIATRNPPFRVVAGYAAVIALSAWMHVTALTILFAHGIVWLALVMRRSPGWRTAARRPAPAALLLGALLALVMNAPTLHRIAENTFQKRDRELVASDELRQARLDRSGKLDVADEAGASLLAEPPVGNALAGPASTRGDLRWSARELAAGLTRAMPGGWAVPLIVTVAVVAGCFSYRRQSGAVLALLVLPLLITMAIVAASNFLVFPRFLFNSAVFVLLLGIRGGYALSATCLPFLAPRQVLMAGVAVSLVGAATLPKAWQPKQDWPAVAAFLIEHRQPGDVIGCVGGSANVPLMGYLGLPCQRLARTRQLEALEGQSARVWLVYAMPAFTARWFPGIWRKVHEPGAYELVRTFGSTIRGGEIGIMLRTGAEAEGAPPE